MSILLYLHIILLHIIIWTSENLNYRDSRWAPQVGWSKISTNSQANRQFYTISIFYV